MKITIKSKDGENLSCNAGPGDSVKKLKIEIQEKKKFSYSTTTSYFTGLI